MLITIDIMNDSESECYDDATIGEKKKLEEENKKHDEMLKKYFIRRQTQLQYEIY